MSQAPAAAGPGRSWTRFIMPTIAGLIAIAVIAFMVQNRQKITVSWLFWSFSWPLWVLLVVTTGLSLLAGGFWLMWRRHRRRVARREARREGY